MSYKNIVAFVILARFAIGPGCSNSSNAGGGCRFDSPNNPTEVSTTIALGTGFLNDSVRVRYAGRLIFDTLALTDTTTGFAWINHNVGGIYLENNTLKVDIPADSVSWIETYSGTPAITVNYLRDQHRLDFVPYTAQ